MKLLLIPGIPLLAIYGSQYLGAHITNTPTACITAGVCVFILTLFFFLRWATRI